MRESRDTRNDWKMMDELIAKASSGDRKAESLLVRRYDGLIRKTAAEYRSEAILCSYEDLVQEAAIGFVEGLRKFDFAKGADFTEWVRYSMRASVRKCLTEKSRLVALPKWRVEQMSKVARAVDRTAEKDGYVTMSALLGDSTLSGMKRKHVEEALELMRTTVTSLDAPVVSGDEESRTLAEVMGSGEDFTERIEALDTLASFISLVSGMDEKVRTVMTCKLGLSGEKMTEKAIGEQIGISPRTVRTIWQKGVSEIREKMAV